MQGLLRIFCDSSFNRDGMYVRVNGHLKSFKGIKQLVAFSVRYGCKILSVYLINWPGVTEFFSFNF